MLSAEQWATLAGGIGLLLLGMALMTEGLRQGAGAALRDVLERFTRTRPRALASGIAVTALVQSSSAVTVAAIGFVNAGVLTLGQVLWVLFGSNVGTTLTGWLVALFGLEFDIDEFALPMIALGMLLRLSGAESRRGGWGLALAGFGLFFLGIDAMAGSFQALAAQAELPQIDGPLGTLVLVGFGAAITMLVQSSSAATAMVLAAAHGGAIGIGDAAAVIIGANVGTTGTAMLAAIGATANARRAAAAHVAFNVLTAGVALLLLPWLVALAAWLGVHAGVGGGAAAVLAMFHTLFNVLGVLLMWPLAAHLAAFLERRFRTAEEDEGRPRYLDAATAAVPALAAEALAREVDRLGGMAVRAAAALTRDAGDAGRWQRTLQRLDAGIDAFVVQMNRDRTPDATTRRVADTLRRAGYYAAVAEQLGLLAQRRPPPAAVAPLVHALRAEAAALLERLDPTSAGAVHAQTQADSAEWERRYAEVKASLYEAAAVGTLAPDDLEELQRAHSALRRCVQQAAKALQLRVLSANPTAGIAPQRAGA
jgi:phosphate:Na+ symporter